MSNTNPKEYEFEVISQDTFWEVITEAYKRKDSIDNNMLGDAIMEVLEDKCSNTALAQFHLLAGEFREAIPRATYDIAKQILPYDSIDSAPYHRFQNWVIALGKGHFEKALKDPSHLLNLKDPSLYVAGQALFEDLDHVASGVYYDREERDPSIQDWDAFLSTERRNRHLQELRSEKDQGLEIEP